MLPPKPPQKPQDQELKVIILVGFWLSHVGWINFLCLGSKIGEKVKSWFLSNLVGELSQTYAK